MIAFETTNDDSYHQIDFSTPKATTLTQIATTKKPVVISVVVGEHQRS